MVTVSLTFEKKQICIIAKSKLDLVTKHETVKWIIAREDELVMS